MKKTMHHPFSIAIAVLVVFSLACSSQVTIYETPVPPNIETVIAATFAAYTQGAPQATSTKVSTATAPPSPTAEEFGEVYVYTIVDNANLRTNPGMLFQVSRVLVKNTRLKLLGQAPGGEWLNVLTDDGIAGWVNENIVLVAYDGPPPPIVEPSTVLLVTGMVETELGTPVSGVGFAVIQDTRRTDVVTDATGQFYAYLPRTMSGMWTVEYISISCQSNTMDSNCSCIGGVCGTANPVSSTVQLPQGAILQFVWK